jgi:hypothetical protein
MNPTLQSVQDALLPNERMDPEIEPFGRYLDQLTNDPLPNLDLGDA